MILVNERPIPVAGSPSLTVLDACRAAGEDVPAFCHGAQLSAGGHCRACLVEVDGRMVAACSTPARDGTVIRTDTDRLRAYRRDLGELIAAEATPAGGVAEVLQAWGVTGTRYAARRIDPSADRSHPYIVLEPSRCILCQACVRACEEFQGQFVFAITGRGAGARLSWGGGDFARSGCVSCGACVEACPTGAITDVDHEREQLLAVRRAGGLEVAAAQQVRTTCGYCGVGCQLDVHAIGDAIVRVSGASAPVNRGHLCVKGRYAHGFVRHADRLTLPLLRRGGQLEPASWDEAIDYVARGFERLRGSVAGLSSSRCTNEENYLLQKWMRGGLGTNDVDCCARVCHAPSAFGMRAAFGTGAATNSLDDLEQAELIMVVGANVTDAHPVTGARIKQAALRGALLVVVDPRRTELASIADVHLQVRPGANVPLLNAMASVLIEDGFVDHDFIDRLTEGWQEYRDFVLGRSPEACEALTGVPGDQVRRAARLFGRVTRPMIVHGLGVTEHHQGSDTVMLLCNLALLRGAVGRPGTGVNPLRGQNNVQGAADMGCQPDLLPGYASLEDAMAVARFEHVWGRPVPRAPGRTLPEMYAAARRGEVRAMFVMGEDVVQTDPNSGHTRETLARLELLVVQEIFPSETTKLAHVVLPGASFYEKDGTFTNGERRIQRVRRVLDPPGAARADWQILCSLMGATGWPQTYRDPSEIMAEIAAVAPSFAGVGYARLEPQGLQWPVLGADHPGTPILYGDGFPRGRARFSRVEFQPSPAFRTRAGGEDPAHPLALVTGRVLEHYNNGSMTRRTPNAQLEAFDAVEIHPADAAARTIVTGQPVVVQSAHGAARARARITDRVERGVVFLSFHFPETAANAVTGDVLDLSTGCPEYKLTAVEVKGA